MNGDTRNLPNKKRKGKYMKQYYVYIMSNKSKTLYIGMTDNLDRRVYEHKNKLIEGFTKRYNLTKLVYYEVTNDVNAAIRREKQLKNWHRQWKINLKESVNPEWRDLSEDFEGYCHSDRRVLSF